MRDPIEYLRERLLRDGISLRAASRYCAELSEHREDIVDHLQAQGLAPNAALAEAQRRLGSTEELVLPMLLDRRNQSLATRWPVVFLAALPLLLQIVASALPVVLLVLAARHLLPVESLPDLVSAIAVVWLILPVIIGWLVLEAARRRYCRPVWPLVGAVCGIVLATAFKLDVAMPVAGQSGAVAVALELPSVLSVAVLLALVILPLWARPNLGGVS